MADTLTNSELARKLSDYVDSEKFGKTYFANWTGANATTYVELPTAPGVTAPQPSLAMILSGVTGPAANAVAAVATVQLVANSVTGQVSIATSKAQAASDKANAAALSATTAESYSGVAGTRADQARVYMELARDYANATTLANSSVSNSLTLILTANTSSWSAKALADQSATWAAANAVAANAALASTLTANTSTWTARNQANSFATNASVANTSAWTAKTSADAVLTSVNSANASSWTARDQANAIAANVAVANTTVQSGVATVATLLSQTNAANTAANASKLAAANAALLANTYVAQAAAYASQINPASYVTNASLTWANVAGKPSLFSTDTANVAGLSTALGAKLDAASFTYSSLPGKPTFFPTDTTNVSGLSAALTAKADDASVNTRITANVATLNSTISGKLDTSAFTWSGLSGKPTTFTPSAHTHVIADVTSLQATLDGKPTPYQGIATGFAAWRLNSLNMDHGQGDGLLNVGANMDHAHMSNASVTGHRAQITGRGASRLGFHDSTLNGYVASVDTLTAGDTIAWVQLFNLSRTGASFYTPVGVTGNLSATGSVSGAAASFTGATTLNGLTMQTGGITFNAGPTTEQTITWKMSDRNVYLYGNASYWGLYSTTGVSVLNYDKTNLNTGIFTHLTAGAQVSGNLTVTGTLYGSNNIKVGSGVDIGLYGDGGNVAIRSYAGSSTVYIQNQSGADTQATFNSAAINLYKPTIVTGNITATGSAFVGTGGGLFVTGQNHRLTFDGAGGTRFNYRSDGATSGLNFYTSEGTFRGTVYADSGGGIGFLNPSNNWRFRTSSGAASVYTDAGVEYAVYTAANLAPMTTNTAQTLNFGVLKEFVTVAGNVWSSASPGNTYANAFGVKGAGGASDSAVISFHRPSQYATHFGLDQYNRFSVGGWSMGDVRRQLWIDQQIPTNTWQSTDDGKTRFYFAANGDSVWKSAAYHQWRNASDTTVASLDPSGTLVLTGELVTPGWIRVNGSNGIYWNTWGGGWNMSDATWMRSYGDKNIVTGGTVQMGAFTVTSDRRLKTDIVKLTGAASILDQTNVYEFTKAGKRMYGVIAQEARQIAPILVSEGADLHPVDRDPILSVDLTGYVPLLIDEVKSLRARVASLEAAA